ncbi:MAG: hypothetical protein ACLT2T_11880, partial [Bilophila wadsworthia]
FWRGLLTHTSFLSPHENLHPRLEGPCKRLRPRRSSGTLPSGGTLSRPWGVLTINMDSYGMDTPFPVRGAFP